MGPRQEVAPLRLFAWDDLFILPVIIIGRLLFCSDGACGED